MTQITVHIVADQKARPYVEHCVGALRAKAEDKHSLQFAVHAPDGDGSVGHGTGLVKALQNAEPEHFNVICDSDTVVLQNGWDVWLRHKLLDVQVIGSAYEDIGSLCAGVGLEQCYKRSPNFSWIAFAPRCPLKKLDPLPSKHSNLTIDTEELSRMYHLPVGFSLLRDVGWRVPSWIKAYDLKDDYLRNCRLQDEPGCEMASKSNELFKDKDARLIVAHQRSSSKLKFMEGDSKTFYECVGRL